MHGRDSMVFRPVQLETHHGPLTIIPSNAATSIDDLLPSKLAAPGEMITYAVHRHRTQRMPFFRGPHDEITSAPPTLRSGTPLYPVFPSSSTRGSALQSHKARHPCSAEKTGKQHYHSDKLSQARLRSTRSASTRCGSACHKRLPRAV